MLEGLVPFILNKNFAITSVICDKKGFHYLIQTFSKRTSYKNSLVDSYLKGVL